MPFSRFMAMALYDPDGGYYSGDRQKTGRQGDFITSVSVGPCLGIILARRLHTYWRETGEATSFDIIEPGAHDGTLAADILREAQQSCPSFYQSIHYHLIEKSAHLRQRQHTRLVADFPGKFSTHTSHSPIRAEHGAVISNELVDAFPVELIKFTGGSWQQQNVTPDQRGGFAFTDADPGSPELAAFCKTLGNAFPDGYTTEYNTGISRFVRDAAASIKSGLFLTIDYGHLQPDYYHPDRSTGTLQTYHGHQKAGNPLVSPGEIDITAHVDFTRLQESATAAGFHRPRFGTQASYLTRHARTWLLEMEKNPDPSHADLVRQFQTLTHPSMLGTRFSVLEMHK